MNEIGFRSSRRGFLAGAAAAAAVAGAGLRTRPARAAGSLKIGTYGGYFQDSFDKHIFPDFTAATGIAVESVSEPTGEAWLVQLETAAKAGQAPADVSMMAQVARLRGEKSKLWAPLDLDKIPNHKYLQPHFVHRYPDGRADGIGAVSWYITLVTNTDAYPEAPTSWAELWDPRNKDSIGLLALASNSFLLEITATLFFGGKDVLTARRHPQGARQAPGGEAERQAVVPRRRPVPAGPAGRRNPDGSVLPRRDRPGRVRGLPGPLDLPEGRRRARFRKLGGIARLGQARGGACLHKLHVPAEHPGDAVAQGRHGADRRAQASRSQRRRVRLGIERHPADPAEIRSLSGAGRLGEPEVDRNDHRGSGRGG
jgi:hypothetical protein